MAGKVKNYRKGKSESNDSVVTGNWGRAWGGEVRTFIALISVSKNQISRRDYLLRPK